MNDQHTTLAEAGHLSESFPGAGVRVMHFRRVFPVLSESFIYDPVVRMKQRGIDTQMLTVVQLPRRIAGVKPRKWVWLPPWLHVPKMLDRLGGKRFQQSELDFWFAPLLNLGLKWQIDWYKPDIVLAHFGPDGCLVLPAARAAGVPLAVAFYGYDVTKLIHSQGDRWRRKYRFLFRYADVLIAISTHIADRLVELGADPRKVVKVHLGADVSRFTYRDVAADYVPGTPVRCVHVGRLTPKKSPLKLLEAFARARSILGGRPPLQLTIVGDGELYHATRERIAELQLGDCVTMTGALPHDQVTRVLAQAHLYTQHCVTTPDGDTEGLGLSFIEASACGLPVIATIHNGIPEVVLHGRTGLLSPEGDADAMAAHIAQLARDPLQWTDLGRAGREHVQQRFTIDHAIDRQMQVLADTVARHRDRLAANAPALGGPPVASEA